MKINPINEDIKSRRVIVIGLDGEKKGEFMRDDAIAMASSDGLDLVLISSGEPPVCKIMDFGKFLYNQKKTIKKNSAPKIKEVKLTPVTDVHDFEVRVRQARDFLEKGNKVKVTVVFNGRHKYFTSQGYEKCQNFFEAISDVAKIESAAQFFGRTITMVLDGK